ncbi:MAG: DUF2059 domain-containing protein [Nitrospirota bacterium]|nr:DUF2059 domain-containing protein [Nitrospirota bacterium]
MKTFIKLFFLLLIILVSAEAGADDENFEKAFQLFREQDYKNAVVYLEKYVAERPDPAAYYMLGYASYELRDFDGAREYFDAAYLIDPDFSYSKLLERAAHPDGDLKLIHDVLEISGAREQISYYADVVGSGLPRLQTSLNEQKIRQELLRLIKESYRFDKIYPSVIQVFQARFQKEHLTAVLLWLKTPVGRKMTALEIAANKPGSLKKMETFVSEYQRMGKGRKKLLTQLEKAISATEMNIEVVSASLLEMLKSMQAQTPEGNRLSSGQIEAIVGRIRDMPRQQLKNNVMVMLAYTYRELTEKELETAVHFYETPAGKWFADTSIRAITSAIGKASGEIGEELGKALAAKNIPI